MDRQIISGISAPARRWGKAFVGLLLGLALSPWGEAAAQVGSARYSAIVMDAGSGRIVSEINQDELRFPASLTKLMTLYMTFEALRDRRVHLQQHVPVSGWAAAQPPSKLGLQPGEPFTVEQAILGLVTKSANDVAAALGELLGGTEDGFSQMMTLRARALGMNRTSFRNASGLPDPDQWTTARDMAALGRRLVLDFPRLYGVFGVSGFIWHNRFIPNHDTLLRTYPGADGMKTGFTGNSGHNLVTSAVRGGVRLVGVVMGAASSGERDQHMAELLDEGFSHTLSGPRGALFVAASTVSGLPVTSAANGPVPPEARPVRDRVVQIGAFPAARSAWNAAHDARRLVPEGQPRVQPVVFGHGTMYLARLAGLSEAEARVMCGNLQRRGPGCQIFRVNRGAAAAE